MKPEDAPDSTVEQRSGFYRRWCERKQASRQPLVEREEAVDEQLQPGDEDMPPLESLDEHADYSGFLSPRVSEALRRLALRKLFHSAPYNICDGLDDYAEDFTAFEKLGDVMTAELRHRPEQEARREPEQEARSEQVHEEAAAEDQAQEGDGDESPEQRVAQDDAQACPTDEV